MGLWDRLRPSGTIKTPLTPAEVEQMAPTLPFVRDWFCVKCNSRLRIRSEANREDGPSNFVMHPPGHPLAGHATLSSGELTWNGMAEERGWHVRGKTVCPACRRGLTVEQYQLKRQMENGR